MVRGKCNCGKRAKSEYLITSKGTAWTIKVCQYCTPKYSYNTDKMQVIDGKIKEIK